MKKISLIITGIYLLINVLIIFGFVWFMLVPINPKVCGRDATLCLGDGTYQIMHGYGNHYDLHNVVDNSVEASLILKYKLVKSENKIYLIGKNQPLDEEYEYTILNYETGENTQYIDVNLFDERDKNIFLNNSDFTILAELPYDDPMENYNPPN